MIRMDKSLGQKRVKDIPSDYGEQFVPDMKLHFLMLSNLINPNLLINSLNDNLMAEISDIIPCKEI